MSRKDNGAPAHFGARLVALRKRAGYTQTELARELNVTRRMIAYYERETEYPPSAMLPQLAQALGVGLEELLGAQPLHKMSKAVNTRLHRRLQQIEQLNPTKKRQVLQLIDAFIERGQLKHRATTQTARSPRGEHL